ncbi:MAG: hypothetical protein RR220_07965 [Bacteroidaceae bacterium]
MKTYCIKLEFQCPYIAQRNGGNKTLYSGLSLKVAYEKLLELYNEKYDCERPTAANWGLAVIQSKTQSFGASPTLKNKTRFFDWDSRIYAIELDDENNED